MNWYKQAQQGKKQYVGDCVSILDDGNFVCADATQLAQMVENGEEISREQFLSMCSVDLGVGRYSFHYNRDYDIAWHYDNIKDVEYFFK